MRVIFFGSAEFATPSLSALTAAGVKIPAVFTQPDRPAGRGRELAITPVKAAALKLGLPVEQPEKLDSAIAARIRTLAPDTVIIIAYGELIPAELLPLAPRGWLNLHPSLLPKYRGAAPVPHCILNGDAETGVTIFRLNEKFDAGDILTVKKIPIAPSATSESLLAELAATGADLLVELLRRENWQFSPQISTGEKSSYAKKFRKSDGVIDWNLPAAVIERRVRAFIPWPFARTFYGENFRQLSVRKCEITERHARIPPATIVIDNGDFYVATGDFLLKLTEIIPEGKKNMSGEEFLRGAHLKTGDVLTVAHF